VNPTAEGIGKRKPYSIVHEPPAWVNDADLPSDHIFARRDLVDFVKAVDVVLTIWRTGDPQGLGAALDELDVAAKAVQR
jgi:hypothetical protein